MVRCWATEPAERPPFNDILKTVEAEWKELESEAVDGMPNDTRVPAVYARSIGAS